jgi:GT2 family glycosyltransferase
MTGAILIIAKNNCHLTKLAVKSAQAQDHPCDVLVIDNASTDGTSQWLRSKSVASITYSRQLSLAQCWNNGIAAFRAISHSTVLVCNNDIELLPDVYRTLRACDLPFVTCVSVENRAQLGRTGNRNILGLLAGKREHPDFSCFMIRKQVTDKVGWFDGAYYPAYAEDSDFHVRMHRAGVTAYCVDLPFLHLGAQTVKTATPEERIKIERGAEANRKRFQAKYGCLPGSAEYYKLFESQQ